MLNSREEIIRQLYKDIMPLQGVRPPCRDTAVDMGLGPIENAFPFAQFPVGAIHDLITADDEGDASTGSFVAALLGRLLGDTGVAVWISRATVGTFAPGLAAYGVQPHHIVFITPVSEKDALWAMEESLRCPKLVAVVAEISALSFIASRRLQLAVEQSRVTGFLIRRRAGQHSPIASVAQWRITSLPTQSQGVRPGRGFPRWKVDLLRVRNSRPGSWEAEWTASALTVKEHHSIEHRKTG